jgi:hypothetical protein
MRVLLRMILRCKGDLVVYADILLSQWLSVVVILMGFWRAFGGFWRHGERPCLCMLP